MRNFTTPPNLQNLKEIAPKAKAFLFDMDGTLLNSELLHAEGLLSVINDFSGENKELNTASSLEKEFIGEADNDVYKKLISDKRIQSTLTLNTFLQSKNNSMIKLLKDSPEKLITNESVFKLLTDLKSNNYKMALVTASERDITLPLLEAAGIKDNFDIIITRNDVQTSKPNPAPYTKAMHDLNLSSEEVFIFEDSPTGLESAKASKADFCQVSWFS
jgi:HAD superfamily hydrolase (TIGR01509 family)